MTELLAADLTKPELSGLRVIAEHDETSAAWRNNPARIFRLVIGEEMRRLLYWCALCDGLVAS